MKSKFVALFLLIVTMLGLGASPALGASAPKQICHTVVANDNTIESQTCIPATDEKALARWSYCSGAATPGYITFWDNQGWCGDSVQMQIPADGQCRLMGAWDNWAGSVYNRTTRNLVLWASSYCGGTPFKTINWGAYDPDLYDDNMGNNTTSMARE